MPNLYQNLERIQPQSDQEVFLRLLETPALQIEQIISLGQSSPPDFWYDQAEDEWVTLLQGTAVLEFADQGMIHLVAGDYLLIQAHCRHRVVLTSEDAVWLAIHYRCDLNLIGENSKA